MRFETEDLIKQNNGFTLIELLLVIGLAVVLASVSIPIYGNWHISVELDETAALVGSTLRLAREKSVSGQDDSFYGVVFQGNRFSLVQVSPVTGATTVREETADSSLEVTTTFSGNQIFFSRGGGVPDGNGTVSITWEDETRTVETNSLGLVELN